MLARILAEDPLTGEHVIAYSLSWHRQLQKYSSSLIGCGSVLPTPTSAIYSHFRLIIEIKKTEANFTSLLDKKTTEGLAVTYQPY